MHLGGFNQAEQIRCGERTLDAVAKQKVHSIYRAHPECRSDNVLDFPHFEEASSRFHNNSLKRTLQNGTLE
jgi:hypothetical protein